MSEANKTTCPTCGLSPSDYLSMANAMKRQSEAIRISVERAAESARREVWEKMRMECTHTYGDKNNFCRFYKHVDSGCTYESCPLRKEGKHE